MGKFQQKIATEVTDFDSPEQYLWTSVLSKAAHDAIYTSDWKEARIAINWFKDKGRNFKEVCELAGKNPDYVYKKIMKAIQEREKNMEWVRTGQRIYVKQVPVVPIQHHVHYRQGVRKRRKTKHLTGNSYYAAKKKKNSYYQAMGKKGGRPRLYNGV